MVTVSRLVATRDVNAKLISPGRFLARLQRMLRLLPAWLVLASYLGAATPIPVLLSSIIASLDDEHTVTLAAGETGLKLILGHSPGNNGSRVGHLSIPHSHCPVAKALVAFSVPSDPWHPDHVLQFGSSLASESSSRGRTATSEDSGSVSPIPSELPSVALVSHLPPFRSPFLIPPLRLALPDPAHHRSTLLQI